MHYGLWMLFVLATIVVFLSSGFAFVVGITTRNRTIVRLALLVGFAWAGVYGLAVSASVLLAHGGELELGDELHFCGGDCHLHVRVTDVARDSSGNVLVAVRLRSDAARVDQYPGYLEFTLRDSQGKAHRPIRSLSDKHLLSREERSDTVRFDSSVPRGSAAIAIVQGGGPDYFLPGAANPIVQKKSPVRVTVPQ